jgi:hypothetical protein
MPCDGLMWMSRAKTAALCCVGKPRSGLASNPPAFQHGLSRGRRPRTPLRHVSPPAYGACPERDPPRDALLRTAPAGELGSVLPVPAQNAVYSSYALLPSYSRAPVVVVGAAARSSRVKPRACIRRYNVARCTPKRRAALLRFPAARRYACTRRSDVNACGPAGDVTSRGA